MEELMDARPRMKEELDGLPLSMPNCTRRSTSSAHTASGGSRYSKGNTPRHRWTWRAAWAERVTAMTAARGRYRDRSWAELREAGKVSPGSGRAGVPVNQGPVAGSSLPTSCCAVQVSLGLVFLTVSPSCHTRRI